MKKQWVSWLVFCGLLPMAVVLGTALFSEKRYAVLSLVTAAGACVPFFLRFERRRPSTRELLVLAVMVAMTVLGRVLFAPLPGFKPVTALVIITALSFGGEMGFLTGAMGALISNFYFGQGPWTPFQMLVWGLLGFFAGVLAPLLKRSRGALLVYGAISGAVYSLLMDLWTVLWWDGGFNVPRYLAALATALPYTVLYMVSNVVFLLVLAKPIGKKLERIRRKYMED
ncbi:MAG: ECF transporter S component [Lachnospiraceae bacterium]|nr:ECF transporter S component [Lachnospiraceae bacterium]